MGTSNRSNTAQSWLIYCGLISVTFGCSTIQTQFYHNQKKSLWLTVNVAKDAANKSANADTTCHAVESECNLFNQGGIHSPLNSKSMEANFLVWLHLVWSALPRTQADGKPRISYVDFYQSKEPELRKLYYSLINYQPNVKKPL